MRAMLSSLGYRQAVKNDIDFLYTLHTLTMKEYVDKTWGWDEAFQESEFRKRFIPEKIQIITWDGNDIGMLSVEQRTDDIFLRAIEVHPKYQNHGIATSIIGELIADGSQKKLPVCLHVLKVNPAKRLYDRLGFFVIEKTQTHYIMLTPIPK